MNRTRIAVIVVLAGVFALWLWNRPPGRVVYQGGPIITMDPQRRVVEALGTQGDRIAIVGSIEEVEAWANGNATTVDLAGQTLAPGFIDAHGHFPGEGIYAVVADLNAPPIGEVETIDDIVETMRDQAASSDEGEWVIGMGYDDSLLAEKRHPTRDDLDRIATDRPVGIIHVSGHLASVNSRGLEEMGYDAETVDPEGGVIQRDSAGVPNGVLEETAAEPVMAGLASSDLMDFVAILREADRRYTSSGTTTAQSGYTTAELMTGLNLSSRLGLIPIRLVVWPGKEAADQMLAGEIDFATYDENWVKVGAIKLIADGSIQGYTGYLSEPYHVPPGDDPEFRGYPRVSPEDLQERVVRYHEAGLPLAVHGNGDAAIDDILDAFEVANEKRPFGEPPPVIIHAQMAREDQLDRMATLGVVPSFFVLHTYYWGDRHRDLFMGPERAARMSPVRGALDRGIRPTLHADSPIVPMEPLRIVWSAVNRLSSSGQVMGAAERVTPMEALAGVTIDAARQHGEQATKGSLEPGKLADLVILSSSPLENPSTIDQIEVIETIVGGETVYRHDD